MKVTRYIVLFAISALSIVLFHRYPAVKERIVNIQSYLITVSGIISGILIAYMASKLFNIKQERQARRVEIDKLAKKLTNYRRILYSLLRSFDFWNYYGHIKTFKKKYPGITFSELHNQDDRNPLVKQFWLEEELASSTIDLYLAMELIFRAEGSEVSEWVHDPAAEFRYSSSELEQCLMPANQIWYFLEGRYGKHLEGEINENGVRKMQHDTIRESLSQIDSKYRGMDFDRHVVGNLSADFHSVYLPRLISLTKANEERMPRSLISIFRNLVVIFISGIIFPLFIQCLNLNAKLDTALTLSAVGVVIVLFFNLLFDLFSIMQEEIRT